MRKLLMVLVMIGIAGCSNKAIYDKFRLDERNKCAKEPPPTYFECIEHTKKSYEEYERERKDLAGTCFCTCRSIHC
ncbi:MAG: hypothetical protein L3J75_16560 [Methylococcaceae bacterium]|nr:hypothetical protein [Methylococcaceae bacterium]